MFDLLMTPAAASTVVGVIDPHPCELADGEHGSTVLDRFVARLEAFTQALERRVGVGAASLVLGLLLVAAACVYVTPAYRAVSYGDAYAQMSESPLARHWNGAFDRRILTPLLAHYLGLRGGRFIFFPLAVMWVFVAAVNAWFRRVGFSGASAMAMAGLMAFSTPLLFQLHFAGYVDPATYLLIFLSLIWARHPLRWPVCFALALLNHECGLFFAPLVFWGAARPLSGRSVLKAGVLLLLSLFPAAALHASLARQGVTALSVSHFLGRENIEHSLSAVSRCLPLGIFMSFKLFWFLPLLAIADLVRRRQWERAGWLGAAVIVPVLQMFVTTDTSRQMGMSYPAILMGAALAREIWGPEAFVRRIWGLIGLNFLVPQYYVGQDITIPFFPLPVSLLIQAFTNVDAWGLYWM